MNTDERPPLTPRAKKALALAYKVAHDWGHNYVGTEHLLAGILREGDGLAAKFLARVGITDLMIRQQTTPQPPAAVLIQRGSDGAYLKDDFPGMAGWIVPEWTADSREAKRFAPEEAGAVLRRLDPPYQAVPIPSVEEGASAPPP